MNEAPEWRVPVTREFIARDFRFHTGETVPELRLGYTVLGNPEGKPVLALHGTGGHGAGLLTKEFGGALFGSGGVLDAAEHFIVLPDAIGHGRSAKPSDGLRRSFPRYNYEDMVQGQYRVVHEALGLRHLRLVFGISMGGMHAWQWGIRHPRFMDALVPLASSPVAMGGRNWLLRRLLVDQVRSDPASARRAWEFFNVATNGGTLALQAAAPDVEAADRWLAARRAQPFETDADDLLYQYDASRDYDPSPALESIRAHVLAINSADDERNPPELGATESAMARLAHGRQLLIPGSRETAGHGTVRAARLWVQACGDFLAAVPSPESLTT
ncbi:Homoserine O-acetyltransferase [Variovorax sp. PBS-H4]|uniref:alpha/beta fold hydrolase n=1 Tax=Variovorax sp. PBS-H4 TaxID=434008 RepID=UPI0013170079|nr:alpha/beta fold hydrolase [Variovorax sp. PBS-H4]VTU28416.1 Homoserine O-acetyltransferase [Variovorax sp. PBS-H4]